LTVPPIGATCERGLWCHWQAALQRREAGPVSPDKALELLQREVLEQVGYEATTADQIIEHSARPASTVLATLSALERAGLVVRWAGGYCRV